jgi:uncharacterized membrane protein YbhN (UPF0104 family)
MRRFFPLIFFLIVLCFSFFFFDLHPRDLVSVLRLLRPWELGALLAVFLAASGLAVFIKYYLLRSVGHPVPFKQVGLVYLSATTAHYSSPAKLGFPVTLYLYKRLGQVPFSITGALLALEIASNLLVAGLFFGLGSMRFVPVILQRFSWVAGLLVLGGLAAVLSLCAALGRDKIGRVASQFRYSLTLVPRSTWWTLPLLMALLHGISGLFLVLAAHFLGSDLSLWPSVVSTATSYFAGALSLIPMGLGVGDFSLLACLKAYGISGEAAVGMLVLQRLFFTVLTFFLGIGAGVLLGVKGLGEERVDVQN